ncbi:uncharacterized protein HMPREF1541_03700 [Cyphellophora europaea CBS 101466]|uniref:Major facilitator superfamily (MFS) profile domain-containing protein n=1 Tax=Cyphellophora europaea (strain CBS 101466) TaxID=1220924 RepID=W2S126_CYPE1|nr:uncharacterized protein HMPREF1541_03700 [Cyphellophora europaea CBS 101466]ETN41763.1 hypothetical protein HMPREF1541_03700 [Cyphellophora europaea CBS 101466]
MAGQQDVEAAPGSQGGESEVVQLPEPRSSTTESPHASAPAAAPAASSQDQNEKTLSPAAAEKVDEVVPNGNSNGNSFIEPSSSASPSEKRSLNNDGNGDEPEPVVSLKVWIVAVILSCGYGLSFWPIPVVAAIGVPLATDLGDPTGYVWWIPAWTVSITVSFMIFGPNTDLLGRRWFLVLGNLVTTVGHIVVATAKNTNQVTAGLAISGFGGACCQMAAFALPELLPNKWRHIGVVIADLVVYAAVIVAPVTARYGYEFNQWEWNFWGCTIFQFLSFVGLLLLYFPPARPNGLPIATVIREIDYLGIVLFTIGAVPVLVGIVYAGLFPSDDPHVVANLVVGFFFLICFSLWETFGKLKHPLAPTHIFTSSWGRDFTAPAIALGVVNMFYYSSSIVWPLMIQNFYTNGGADWEYGVILSLPQGFGIFFGAMLLTCLGSRIKNWQWQLTGAVFIMVLFGSLLGMVTPDNKGLMTAFLFLSQTGFGWALYLAIAITQMGVEQKDLGIAGGVSGTFRFAAGAIATAVYTTVLNNKVAEETANLVPPAALGAGLEETDLAGLFEVLGTPAFATEYGSEVVLAVTEAMNEVYCRGIFLVAMVSLAFGIVGLVACALCKDVDAKMNNKIEVYLENTNLADRNKYH